MTAKVTKRSGTFKAIRYWCQDETRLGLKTIQRRKLTLTGVKPVGVLQWERETYYLYGVVEPKTGESCFCEISHLDTECFQEFLNYFSRTYPEELHILQLDRGPFHTTKKLRIPENIKLLFQPSHCPELNPIERLWEYIKGFLSWELFGSLSNLKTKVTAVLNSLNEEVIASLTGWDYILDALSVAGI